MIVGDVWAWLTNGANWSGTEGIPTRLLEHLQYTGITLLIAMAIALPLGTWIAHSGRGKWLITVANAARAVPSLGLLLVLALWLQPKFTGDSNLAFLVPAIAALVVLALPPLLAGAYAGVSEIDPAARDAAKGMGMTGREVFGKVELPCALPLIFSGIRSATLQVVATATIAAFISLGGLGRYLIDGQTSGQADQMIGGSVLVALLALVLDLVLGLIQRTIVSPGLSGRVARRRRRDQPTATGTESAPASATKEQAAA